MSTITELTTAVNGHRVAMDALTTAVRGVETALADARSHLPVDQQAALDDAVAKLTQATTDVAGLTTEATGATNPPPPPV